MNNRRAPFDRLNSEVHQRLEAILDEVEPQWRTYYIVVPRDND